MSRVGLKILNLDELSARRSRRDLAFLFNCIHSKFDCPCLVSSVHLRVPSRPLRPHGCFDVDRSMSLAPASRCQLTYNSLFLSPIDVFCSDLVLFKRSLKCMIFWIRMLWRGRSCTSLPALVFPHIQHYLAYLRTCSYVPWHVRTFSCAYSRHILRAFTIQKCLRLLSITLHFCIYLSALPHLPIFDLYAAHICTVCIPCIHASMYVACSYSLYLCMRCITREGPVLLVSTSNK